MDATARSALALIRRCVASGRFILRRHFTQRMDERGLLWPDVLMALDDPMDVEDDGLDDQGRDKWIVRGRAADGLGIELVCAFARERKDTFVVFITLYRLKGDQ